MTHAVVRSLSGLSKRRSFLPWKPCQQVQQRTERPALTAQIELAHPRIKRYLSTELSWNLATRWLGFCLRNREHMHWEHPRAKRLCHSLSQRRNIVRAPQS